MLSWPFGKSVPVLLLAFMCSCLPLEARQKDKPRNSASAKLTEQQRALHALNRLTFGPRPGDVERVMAMGVDKWIEQQLHPEKIDDRALQARLAPLRTLTMDTRTMVNRFPPQQVIKAVAEGKLDLPSDPELRTVYKAQLEHYQQQQERKQSEPSQEQSPEQQKAQRLARRRVAEQQMVELMPLPAQQRYRELLAMDEEDRRALTTLSAAERERMMSGFTPQQREMVMAAENPQAVVVSELLQGKVLRAIYSERQLEGVMTDFWYNHFNVFLGKGADRYMITSYERDVIRPRVFGKFQDLLVAVAKSPAMLFYLDNWQSVGPDSVSVVGKQPFQAANAKRQQRNRNGLNENYARELMELHTLGVDGGYTQQDVTQVARVFTGWTLEEPRKGGDFTFDGRKHEPGPKVVLGKQIQEHGEEEGVEALQMLAHHPSTARFLSTKLAQRFVSDTPPKSLVDRMSRRFLKSDGDIREVLRTMFHSPEFWSSENYRAKVKTPLEYAVSAVRATGGEVEQPAQIAQALNRMSMPLYNAQPPTGYSSKASSWVSSAALLSRMNFALALTGGRIPGVTVNMPELMTAYQVGKHKRVEAKPVVAPDGDAVLAQLEKALVCGEISERTQKSLREQWNEPQTPNLAQTVGLLLGSPEFQRK